MAPAVAMGLAFVWSLVNVLNNHSVGSRGEVSSKNSRVPTGCWCLF